MKWIILITFILPYMAFAHCGKCGVGDKKDDKAVECPHSKKADKTKCQAKDHANCPYCKHNKDHANCPYCNKKNTKQTEHSHQTHTSLPKDKKNSEQATDKHSPSSHTQASSKDKKDTTDSTESSTETKKETNATPKK